MNTEIKNLKSRISSAFKTKSRRFGLEIITSETVSCEGINHPVLVFDLSGSRSGNLTKVEIAVGMVRIINDNINSRCKCYASIDGNGFKLYTAQTLGQALGEIASKALSVNNGTYHGVP